MDTCYMPSTHRVPRRDLSDVQQQTRLPDESALSSLFPARGLLGVLLRPRLSGRVWLPSEAGGGPRPLSIGFESS